MNLQGNSPTDQHDLVFHANLVASSAFIAANATVLGQVEIQAKASVWFGAVIRGDIERVLIGAETNIQDQCVIHADPGFPCEIGERVVVGHAAVVHGAIIESDCMIGIGAIVLNGARIGAGSIVGAGCVVPEGMQVPPYSVAMGVPAKLVRQTTDTDRNRIQHGVQNYVNASRQLLNRS
ncbi:MAG: gamma carbonic anhydrase family protein [Pirellulaceae bacterium]